MSKNKTLSAAKNEKNDEFYTLQPEYQRNYIYADHVTPWSNGGKTVAENC